MKHLLIISHTGHYYDPQGRPCGWTPTVREIDFLATHYQTVTHLAVLDTKHNAPKSTSPYAANNVTFVGIPPFGGGGLINKLKIPVAMLILWWKLRKLLPRADVFQFRAPTSIGLFVIPYTRWFSKTPGWFKYAGNWEQPNMPWSYRIQKRWLTRQRKRPVTINGKWPHQPNHVHTFENPCLSDRELPKFRSMGSEKSADKPFTACFVGRMEDAKGVQRIVDALMQSGIEKGVDTMHFVGDGPKLKHYRNQLLMSEVDVVFHGFLDRDATFDIYAKSHLLFLPSDSEGFPKVVAEAAAFGCVPMVSDVSSIGQYINDSNGYLFPLGELSFTEFLSDANLSPEVWRRKHQNAFELARSFTFEHYLKKLEGILS